MGRHRSRPTAVGGARRHSNGRRRHADAWPLDSFRRVRRALRRPGRDRHPADRQFGARDRSDHVVMSMELGLPEVVAFVTMVALNAYVLTGGADFGGGVWDLCTRGPRAAEQRHLIEEAIGPIWEANHVWLIVVVVMLLGA